MEKPVASKRRTGGSSLFGNVAFLFLVIGVIVGLLFANSKPFPKSDATTIFDFAVESAASEQPVPLSDYKGKKAYLVVNVASQCGLTDKNYAELTELYDKYSSQGLEILAFPCNNFGKQEPGTNEEIGLFATEKKGATFPVFGKLECEHSDPAQTHPLYQYLKTSVPAGITGQGLKWNFAKFLCDENGVPIDRYLPITSPFKIEKDIVELLSK